MPGFHVEHFGCRAARADGEAIGSRLSAAGQHSVKQLSDADVVIVNSCSVTAEADRQARAFIRRAHRLNPEAKIVVTGCYAQRAPEELAGIAGVAAVVGNSHKALAPQIIQSILSVARTGAADAAPALVSVQSLLSGNAQVWVDDRFAHSFIEEAQLVPGAQTRPNLKIQEGCGNRCSFCVIPQTRGSSKSLAAATVFRHVEEFVAAGGQELVLSGINLGRWGRDFSSSEPSPRTLAELVRHLLECTGLPRLRLSSIEPMDWDSDLIALMREFGGRRLARHAHLPLQSGSDAVLRRMFRRYRPWHYVEKIEALLGAAGPDLTIGADVMVGFPGETDAEFAQTLDFVRNLPFGYLHLFPFSPRPGTRAWPLHAESAVPHAVVADRMAALRSLAAQKSRTHRERFIGRELEAITLHTPPALVALGRSAALTGNFLPVEVDGQLPANRLLRVSLTGISPEGALQACHFA
jgi:threonylcarbamoyladenosine tRNA methylthiotransferase MtaB